MKNFLCDFHFNRLSVYRLLALLMLLAGFQYIDAQSKVSTTVEDTVVVEIFTLPSPDEIIEYVSQGKVNYRKDILLSTERMDERFVSSKDKYIAFGMFLADLAYTISFKKYGNSLSYLQALEELGRELNVMPPHMNETKERFVTNMDNLDSLKAIYFEIYEMVMMNFYENNRFEHYTLISSGIFIESLFISIKSVDMETQTIEFKHRVWEQRLIFDHLSQMIERNVKSNTKSQLQADLKPLGEMYKKHAGTSPPETVKPRRNSRVIIIGQKAEPVNLEVAIPEVQKEIEAVRAKWSRM
jgi:hypothetical protein